MTKRYSILVAVLLTLLLCAAFGSCGLLVQEQETSLDREVFINGENSTAGSDKNGENGGKSAQEMLKENEIPLEGNPVFGAYTTTSGIYLDIGEDGTYSWDETHMVGHRITGIYTIFHGTQKQNEDGTQEYVYESDTGPVYSLFVVYDQEEVAGRPILDATMLVFDTYTEDIFRVTDLVSNIWFEAERRADESADAWSSAIIPVNLKMGKNGDKIRFSWDALPGAEEYGVVILQLSLSDVSKASLGRIPIPDPVFDTTTDEAEVSLPSEMFLVGEVYTLVVSGMKNVKSNDNYSMSRIAYKEFLF